MTLPSNTTTQPAHLIKMECNGCGGFGRRNSKDPMQDDRICYYCIKGQIEYIVFPIKGKIIKYSGGIKILVIGSQKNNSHIKYNIFLRTFLSNQYYKSGDTVPTSAGPRIAGKIKLTQGQDILDDLWKPGRITNAETMYQDFVQTNNINRETWLCIAKSHPVKITE